MKFISVLATTLVLATLTTHCNKHASSSSLNATDNTVAQLLWGPKTLNRGLETSLGAAFGQIFEYADKNKNPRFTCKNTPGVSDARDCTISSQSSGDSVMCGYAHKETSPTKIWVRCIISASNWPQMADDISNVIAPEFLRLGFAQGSSFTSVSDGGKMSCQEADRLWHCSFADFSDLSKEVSIPKKQSVKVPEGLKDEFGTTLPSRSKDYVLNLPSGVVTVSSYRAPDKVLAAFMDSIAREKIKLDDHSDESSAPDCKEAEKVALVYYTGEGYKVINAGLRNLAKGEKPDTKTEWAILASVSAFNCVKQASAKIVVRGANLNDEKLAKYQKDAIIVEHAFTSTTIGTEVITDFKGNTEFRIIAARGANLADFGAMAEEGEEELIIAPGTLFKVLDRRVQNGTTIIELQQLP